MVVQAHTFNPALANDLVSGSPELQNFLVSLNMRETQSEIFRLTEYLESTTKTWCWQQMPS